MLADPASPATSARFTEAGLYVFELAASDGVFTASDRLEVRVGPSACALPAPQGLVAWWPGNGTYAEKIAGIETVPVSGLALAPAQVAEGFLFDGSNDMLYAPADSRLDIGAGSGFTVEAWLYRTERKDVTLFAWVDSRNNRLQTRFARLGGSARRGLNSLPTTPAAA